MWSDILFACSLLGLVVYYAQKKCNKQPLKKKSIEITGTKMDLKNFLQNLDDNQGH